MVFIVTFGLIMVLLSLQMMKKPGEFSAAIIKFSNQSYFHIFEILSRLIFGLIFIYYAPSTSAVMINTVLGYLMLFTSILLVFLGAQKHRKFALWSARKFRSMFRFSGIFSFVFGVYIVYSAVY
jgi:uncharacterized membrane protein HdeD (DUF308 family)